MNETGLDLGQGQFILGIIAGKSVNLNIREYVHADRLV